MRHEIETVQIGEVPVGDDHPAVFMAEIGTFFNKDIELACDLLRGVVEAGAQVLKTEVLHNPNVCLKNTGVTHRYKHVKGETIEDYRALVERKVVPLDDYRRLFQLCHESSIPFVCSVYDKEGIDFVVDEGGAAIKFTRNNLNNVGLIRYAGKAGLPILFDAGNVYLDELALAVRTAQEAGAGGVIINLHPAANPAPPEFHHFRVAETYKRIFRTPIGLACHYRGDELLYAAVGAGVNLLEKGVVDDNKKEEQDLVSAANLSEVKEIVQKVRRCWFALGQDQPVVREPREYSSWRGMVAKRNIAQGEPFSLENVGFAWPPLGLSPLYWDLVEGKSAIRRISKDETIAWLDVGH